MEKEEDARLVEDLIDDLWQPGERTIYFKAFCIGPEHEKSTVITEGKYQIKSS